MAGETIDRNDAGYYVSSPDNFKSTEWSKAQLEAGLNALDEAEIKSFFTVETGSDGTEKVEINTKSLKKYLTDLSTKNYNDIWRQNGGNTIPQTTAIQIALEMHGIEIGNVDGIYGNKTIKGVKEFQTKWNAEHPNDKLAVDGKVGPKTMQKMVESFPADRTHRERSNDGSASWANRARHRVCSRFTRK